MILKIKFNIISCTNSVWTSIQFVPSFISQEMVGKEAAQAKRCDVEPIVTRGVQSLKLEANSLKNNRLQTMSQGKVVREFQIK